eukprot:15008404-Heterocapsa_arctica.AAC.1
MPIDDKGKVKRPARVFRLCGEQAVPFALWCHQYYAKAGKYGPGEFPPPGSAPHGVAWPVPATATGGTAPPSSALGIHSPPLLGDELLGPEPGAPSAHGSHRSAQEEPAAM